MQYRRDIDGLRALAVLPVILFHAGFETFSGGFVGVDIFFVISGYLITSIIVGELASGNFSFASFYERRARRILPALSVVILASIPAAWLWMLPDEFIEFGRSMLSIAVFASNFYFRTATDYFGAAAEEKPLLHTWSLAVEEQYYFVFPLLLWALWRWGRARIGILLATLAAVSLAFAEWQVRLNPDQIFFDTRGRIWELLGGALVALYHSSSARRAHHAITHHIGAALGLGLIVYAIVGFDESTESPGLPIALPVLGAMLVILFSTPATIAGKILGSKPFVGIGLISYSAYLWHQPLLAFTRLRTPDDPSSLALGLSSILALALAYPTWRFVEQPFRNRARIGRRPIAIFALTASVTMAALGALVVHKEGFDYRFEGDTTTVQVLDNLHAERGEITRSGECQYNRKTAINSFELFVKSWRCDEDPKRPELRKIGVIVAGDSHSADIASALRTNGFSPAQIGAPGCSVIPSRMSKGCRHIFTFIRDFAAKRPEYTHIILANRWDTKEVSELYLSKMVKFWQLPGKTIVFVSSRPEFHSYKRALRLGLQLEPNMKRADTSSSAQVFEFLHKANVQTVNAREIFCALTSNCSWRDSAGRHLTTDGHHLTRLGAQLFGEKMLALGILPTSPISPRPAGDN